MDGKGRGTGGIGRVHPRPNIGCNADPVPNWGFTHLLMIPTSLLHARNAATAESVKKASIAR